MRRSKFTSKRSADGKGRKMAPKQKTEDYEIYKKVTKRRTKVEYKDYIDDYEPSDSDNGLDKSDKILLDNRRGTREAEESEEEVLGIHSSSSDEREGDEANFDGGGVESDMDSDIDNSGNDLDEVDTTAWGKNKKMYYNTDYVDKDSRGMSKEEEELADMEEEEARNIQKRLFAQMETTDFTLGMLDYVEQKKAEMKEKKEIFIEDDKITTDLSGMTKEEKIQLLKQDSPIAFKIIDDFQNKMELVQTILKPVLDLVKQKKFPQCTATNFVETYYGLILNYCTNIVYYFVHRSSQKGNNDSPVVQRLLTYRKVLDEMDIVLENQLMAPLQAALKKAQSNALEKVFKRQSPEVGGNRAQRRKRKLQILKEKKKLEKMVERKKATLASEPNKDIEEPLISESDEEIPEVPEEEMVEEQLIEEGKRGITYQMRKNKGLTPRRKKENRNPRVKNKNKYRKALIRRKGQIREVRTEVTRYGGELSGIKAYTSKSVKFKN